VIWLLALALLVVQAPAPAPALSEVDRLKLQNIAQRIEIAQLKYQAAQREFEGARGDLTKLMEALKVEGYTLDLATMTYQKEKPAK
jgi:hypothetical protein